MTNTAKESPALSKARETANRIKAESEAEKQKTAPAKAQETAEKVNAQLSTTTPPVTTGRQFGKFLIRKAERAKAKLRIGLAGPSGSGKTYSALLLAHGIAEWDKILIIDTENGSADLYSDLGPFNVITLEKPFHPDRYVEAIQAGEEAGMEVIIVDSMTHEWNGEGGALDLQEKLGGRFQDWAKVTPIHNRFVRAIIDSPIHMITTVRSKTDYAMSNEGGKSKVQKVGLKPEQREGLEYEMTLTFDLNVNNMAETSKDRTGLFKGASPFVITEQTGQKLAEWASSGVDMVGIIRTLLKQKGKAEDILTTHFKVLSLDELTPAQLKATIQRLEQLPDYDEEAEKKKAEEEAKAKAEAEKKAAEQKAADEKAAADAQEVFGAEQPNDKPESEEIDVDEISDGIDRMNAEKEGAK